LNPLVLDLPLAHEIPMLMMNDVELKKVSGEAIFFPEGIIVPYPKALEVAPSNTFIEAQVDEALISQPMEMSDIKDGVPSVSLELILVSLWELLPTLDEVTPLLTPFSKFWDDEEDESDSPKDNLRTPK